MDEQKISSADEWEQFRSEILAERENREAYEWTLNGAVTLRILLQQVKDKRTSTDFLKTRQAKLVGMNPPLDPPVAHRRDWESHVQDDARCVES